MRGGSRWEGGRTNERPGIDHVISGPMRGLKKTAPDGANTHIDFISTRNVDLADTSTRKEVLRKTTLKIQ